MKKCIGNEKDRETCNSEKMGCDGCYFYREIIERSNTDVSDKGRNGR